MCETSELIVMVADSNEKSRNLMCDALAKIGLQNILCAIDSKTGIEFICDKKMENKQVNMLFVNTNLKGMPLNDFITSIDKINNGIIAITYSKCIQPEAHIMSMFFNGSFDHIEQNENFENKVKKVTSRWMRAAKLQFDYGKRYGATESVF